MVVEALGEKEAAWRQCVGELEVMLGVRMVAKEGGGGEAVELQLKVDRQGEELRERLCVVVRERDDALRLLAEVRKVMCMAAGAAVG